MKHPMICLAALAAPLLLPSCVNVRPPRNQAPHVTTTTTEETTTRMRPGTTTIETQNVRSY